MKNIIVGFILGVVVATTVSVYAAPIAQWVMGNGTPFGTPSDPIYVTTN